MSVPSGNHSSDMSSSHSWNPSGNPTPSPAVTTATPQSTPISLIGYQNAQPVLFGYGYTSHHHGHAHVLPQPNPFYQWLIYYQLQQWNLQLNSLFHHHFHQPQTSQHQSNNQFANGRKYSKNRVPVTRAQLAKLEERFEKNKFILKLERAELGKAIGLSEAQVKSWFQYKRQKLARQNRKEQQEKTDEEIDV